MKTLNPPPLLSILLSSVPFFFLLVMVLKYSVNIPFMDQWGMIFLFEHYYSGDLSFMDFWVQENEHRLVFPKLIFLGLGIYSKYNVTYEMFTSLVIACLIYLTIIMHINRNKEIFNIKKSYRWLWIILSLFIFSLSQAGNWLWGFQIQWFLNILAVIAGAFIIANFPINLFTISLTACFGIIATFSLASGILYWIIIQFILIAYKHKSRSSSLPRYGYMWFITSVCILVIYLIDYHTPRNHPGLLEFLHIPFQSLAYIAAYIGSPLSCFGKIFPLAVIIGSLGIGFYVYFLVNKISCDSFQKFRSSSFFLILGMYGILSSILTCVGRVGFDGPKQALVSRYTTVAIIFWTALFFMIYAERYHERVKSIKLKNVIHAVKYTLLGIIFIGVVYSSFNSISLMVAIHGTRSCGKQSVLEGRTECLQHLFISPQQLVEYDIPRLKSLGLSVFSDRNIEKRD